ncbi:MAG: S41 family peptidase, partial [Pyrinomonadaceae bacterium]
MSFKNKFILVTLSASLALYAVIGGLLSTRAQPQNDPGTQLRIFESVLQHIQHDYVDEPNLEKVRAGALRGLADGLDPYSTYLTPEQVANYQKKDASQVGIGAELSQVQSFLYVVSAAKGSPAELAGIRAGDTIEYIDGKATRDISLYDAYQLLNGAPGSEVKLRVIRAPRPLTINVRRAAFKPAPPELLIESDKIGVIRVNNLAEGAAVALQTRLEDVIKQGCQKVVLDLRNVAGGSLNEAIKVANFFIKDGVIAKTIGRENKVINTFTADPQKKIFDGQLVAIIDPSTAGPGEVIASALIENKRGSVVGEKSFGAGTEQSLFT